MARKPTVPAKYADLQALLALCATYNVKPTIAVSVSLETDEPDHAIIPEVSDGVDQDDLDGLGDVPSAMERIRKANYPESTAFRGVRRPVNPYTLDEGEG